MWGCTCARVDEVDGRNEQATKRKGSVGKMAGVFGHLASPSCTFGTDTFPFFFFFFGGNNINCRKDNTFIIHIPRKKNQRSNTPLIRARACSLFKKKREIDNYVN